MTTRSGREPVVAGVDGSAVALDAVRWAARRAGRDGRPLRLVHAYHLRIGDEEAALTRAREQGRRWLSAAVRAATDDVPGLTVAQELLAEPTETGLLREAESAAVVVLGNNNRGPVTGLLAGSTSLALAGRAACPVVLVRDAAEPPGPVVVGVDGTEASEGAIAFAFAEASARHARLVALYVWSETLLEAVAPGGAFNLEQHVERHRERAAVSLAERLAGWQGRYPEVRVERDLVHDRPVRALRRCAETAQLLVVGRRGRSGVRDVLLGSTCRHVLHHASCPVAVVRGAPAG